MDRSPAFHGFEFRRSPPGSKVRGLLFPRRSLVGQSGYARRIPSADFPCLWHERPGTSPGSRRSAAHARGPPVGVQECEAPQADHRNQRAEKRRRWKGFSGAGDRLLLVRRYLSQFTLFDYSALTSHLAASERAISAPLATLSWLLRRIPQSADRSATG